MTLCRMLTCAAMFDRADAAVWCGMTQLRRALTDIERLDWLRLIRTENVGPVTFARLMERFDTPGQAIQALPELAKRGGRKAPLRVASRAEAEREVAALTKFGARLIASCEPDYPQALAAIDDAPPLISVIGHPHLLRKRAVAMVGARNASINGKRFAEMLARDLGAAGYIVVSGLARGIDTSAHAGALASGTIAVVAGGLDVVYPEENRSLQERIAEQGVVVAECPIGTQPLARHFPTAEPDNLRSGAGSRGDRGDAQVRLADHRPRGGRPGARGLRGARIAARPALAGTQPVAARRSDRDRAGGRHRPGAWTSIRRRCGSRHATFSPPTGTFKWMKRRSGKLANGCSKASVTHRSPLTN